MHNKINFKSVWNNYKLPIVTTIIIAILFSLIGLMPPFNDWSFIPNATLFANFGDFIGGFLGTLLSLCTLLAIYITFKENRSHFRQERFESRFFELTKRLNETVEEMKIGETVQGRKSFLYMYKEFKAIYFICSVSSPENPTV